MTNNYYGLYFNPFDKDIATKDAFLSSDMKEMNGRLDYLKNNQGIGVFTAGAGQGKTFSLRCFSDKLNPNITKFTYICLSTVTTTELYQQLCISLGLDSAYKKSVMFKSIQEYFENLSINKKIHQIVCLDNTEVDFSSGMKSLIRLGFNLYNGWSDRYTTPMSLLGSLDNHNLQLVGNAIMTRFNSSFREGLLQ